MPLVLAGIDEAGYGPTLGPLCVGMSAFRLHGWDEEKSPNLWSLLSGGVCRRPGRGGGHDRRGRIAVADSKQLKLANSVETTHPLVHLERGVLAFLGARGERIPESDDELFAALGVCLAGHECYAGPARALPVSTTRDAISVAANVLRRALDRASVSVPEQRVECLSEPAFNAIVHDQSSKAEATAAAITLLCRRARAIPAEPDRFAVVCDRQGGRTGYAPFLSRVFEPDSVETLEESPARSRYLLHAGQRRIGVSFLVEGEGSHLPIALASMMAKYVRELLMLRFNAYWSARALRAGLDLKPTAGYSADARRWLADAATVLTGDDRRLLIRTC